MSRAVGRRQDGIQVTYALGGDDFAADGAVPFGLLLPDRGAAETGVVLIPSAGAARWAVGEAADEAGRSFE